MSRFPSSLYLALSLMLAVLLLDSVVPCSAQSQPSPIQFNSTTTTGISTIGATINVESYQGVAYAAYIASTGVYWASSSNGIAWVSKGLISSDVSGVNVGVDPELLVVNGLLFCFFSVASGSSNIIYTSFLYSNQTWSQSVPVSGGTPSNVKQGFAVSRWGSTTIPGVSGTSTGYVFAVYADATTYGNGWISLLQCNSNGAVVYPVSPVSVQIKFPNGNLAQWLADPAVFYTNTPVPTLTIIQKAATKTGTTTDYILTSTTPYTTNTWISGTPNVNGVAFTSASGYTAALFSFNSSDCLDIALVAHTNSSQTIIVDFYIVPLQAFAGDYDVEVSGGVPLKSTTIPEALFFTPTATNQPTLFLYYTWSSLINVAVAPV